MNPLLGPVSLFVQLVIYLTNICYWGKLKKNGFLDESLLELKFYSSSERKWKRWETFQKDRDGQV